MSFTESELFGSLRSGASFNDKKFSKDVDFFKTAIKNPVSDQNVAPEEEFALYVPARNLDFFRTGTSLQRKKQKEEPLKPESDVKDEEEIKSESEEDDDGSNDDSNDDEAGEEGVDENGVTIFGAGESTTKKKKNKGLKVVNEIKKKEHKKLKMKKLKRTPQQHEALQIIKSNKIHCTRKVEALPPLLKTFDDLNNEPFNFPKSITQNVKNLTNNSNPTPIQSIAIPLMTEANDLICQAPTGSGKTAGYVLPIIDYIYKQKLLIKKANKQNKGDTQQKTKKISNTDFRACIVGPTKELVDQIFREFEKLSVNLGENITIKTILLKKKFYASILKAEGEMKFDGLISTPTRLAELVRNGRFNTVHLKYIVFDEADRLFELGFLPQIDEILDVFGMIQNRCISIWSATIPPTVVKTSESFLVSPTTISVGVDASAAASIRQSLLFSGRDAATKLGTIRMLLKREINPLGDEDLFPMMIFVETKERARALYREIVLDPGAPIICGLMESEMPDKVRERMIRDFRVGKIWILICTDLMARGIDFKGVKGVVNFDLPTTMKEYIHRIGRTGRGNNTGWAVSLWSGIDATNGLVRQIRNVIRNSGGELPEWMDKDGVNSVLPEMPRQEKRDRNVNPGKYVAKKELGGDIGGGGYWLKKQSRKEGKKRKRQEIKKFTKRDNQQNGNGKAGGRGGGGANKRRRVEGS